MKSEHRFFFTEKDIAFMLSHNVKANFLGKLPAYFKVTGTGTTMKPDGAEIIVEVDINIDDTSL